MGERSQPLAAAAFWERSWVCPRRPRALGEQGAAFNSGKRILPPAFQANRRQREGPSVAQQGLDVRLLPFLRPGEGGERRLYQRNRSCPRLPGFSGTELLSLAESGSVWLEHHGGAGWILPSCF